MNTLPHKRSTNFTVVAPVVGTGFVYFASTLAEEQIQSCISNAETGIGSMSASRKVRSFIRRLGDEIVATRSIVPNKGQVSSQISHQLFRH